MSNLLAVCSLYVLCHAAINHVVGNFGKGLRYGRPIKNKLRLCRIGNFWEN